MRLPLWVAERADDFWRAAGKEEPFPRSLRKPMTRALQATIIPLPSLNARAVQDWLRKNDRPCPPLRSDRSLHACLVAQTGQGFIFLDNVDSEDEQRFSLAHEIAHLLRHYLEPRQRVERKLGKSALEVLDGIRPPTESERLQAILSEVAVGPHVHVMERDPIGQIVSGRVAVVEEEADRLAFELLAPVEAILRFPEENRKDRKELGELLRETFGLPESPARQYSELLLPIPFVDPLLRTWGIP